MDEPFEAADMHCDNGVAEGGIVAGDDEVARPGQHQVAGDSAPRDLCDGRLGEVAPAARELEVDLLLPCHAAMGAAFIETAPGAEGWKVDAGLIAAARMQIVARGEMEICVGEDDDLGGVVRQGAVEGGVEVVCHH